MKREYLKRKASKNKKPKRKLSGNLGLTGLGVGVLFWVFESGVDAYNKNSDHKELTGKLLLLTDKESQVLKCLLAGKNDKQIAVGLDLARRTAAFHRANILEKLESGSIVELAKTVSELAISI